MSIRNRLVSPPAHPAIAVREIDLLEREMELVIPFETSFGRMNTIRKVFPKIKFALANGKTATGIGECPTLPAPWYDGESYETVVMILKHFIVTSLMRHASVTNVLQFRQAFGWIVGHNIAKVGVEGAYWDAVGKILDTPVYKLWGGKRTTVETGTSVGLEKTDEEILAKVDFAVAQKVKRVKIKIKPGRDVTLVEKIRIKYPKLPLQVDGNAAYHLANAEHIRMLQKLDTYGLIMIEQPGPNDDRYYHAIASEKIKTPICLDESILHVRHAQEAIDLWSNARILKRLIINIKPPRVGGFWEAAKIANLCEAYGVPTWCGGMLESSVGKIANLHLSSLSGVMLPGDHISQRPYFTKDVSPSPVCVNGVISIPDGNGWGIGEFSL